MSDNLIGILFWLLGWFILSIGDYIYNVYIDENKSVNKKVHAWRSFWIGFWSWFGILFVIVFFIVSKCAIFNDWVETKLNK